MKNKIVLIMLLIVCVTVMCFTLLGSVSAAEIDSNSIYNFNQLFTTTDYFSGSDGVSIVLNNNNSVSVTGTNTGSSSFINLIGKNFSSSNLVYFKCTSEYTQYSVNGYNFTTDYIYRVPTTYKCNVAINLPVGQSIDTQIYVYCIDLTLMFGAGNEPTIDQCRQIFTSEYYNYTTGTPLSLSGINAYQQGVNDTLNSYNVTTNPIITYNQAFSVNVSGSYNDVIKTGDNFNTVVFCGGVGLPFLTTLSSGTDVTVYISSFGVPNVSFIDYIALGYYLDSTFIPLYSFDISSPSSSGSVSFTDLSIDVVLPVDLNYLVICAFVSTDNSLNVQQLPRFVDLYMSYKSFNNQILINNAYDTGYSSGLIDGKNQGYQSGYTAGINAATQNDYSFLGLLSSVVQAPITVLVGDYDTATGQRVGGLLNFEFLGYNMSTFLMSLFSMSIVICVVRLFI